MECVASHQLPPQAALPPQGGLGARPFGPARLPSVPPKRGPAVAESAPGSGCEAPASTKGSTSSPSGDPQAVRQASRREAYGLRSGHRRIVGDLHASVACCGLGRIPLADESPADCRARLVCAAPSENDQVVTSSVQGLTRCASPWACPVCAPVVAAARGEALCPQVQVLTSQGWSAWLLTLTVKHGREQPLAEVFDALKSGWGKLTNGKAWQAMKAKGDFQYVRGYDLTHSERHGWHPHVHLSIFLPPGHGDGRVTAEAIVARWQTVMSAVGWETSPDAQNATRCTDPVKAARYSVTPAAVYESVALAKKRSRNLKSGRTPFEILALAVADADADLWKGSRPVALWREYVQATKGRRQVTASRGITLIDDPLVDESGDVLAELGQATVAELDRERRMPELLEAVEVAALERGWAGWTREAAREVLDTLQARDWRVTEVGEPPRRRGPPEPLPFVPWVPPVVPEVFPPARWITPFSDDGRTWRKVTRADLAILVRMERDAREALCSTGGLAGGPPRLPGGR